MDALNYFLYAFIVCLSLTPTCVYAEDVCVKRSGCSCVFPNGTGVDLSPATAAINVTFYSVQLYEARNMSAQIELSTYYYHPCVDVKPSFATQTTNNTCNVPLSLCRHRHTLDAVGNGTYKLAMDNYEWMGNNNFVTFNNDGRLIYYSNGPSGTLMMLICTEDSEDKLQVYSLDDPANVTLAFYSQSACFRQLEAAGRSTGSTLVIIFFCFAIFYLVLGICTKKFLMGATGIEVVPNLAFWSDLPNLVKDGWLFAVSGCRLPARAPAPAPDPNSYDSI